ncbi:hypothetical protein ACLB1G_17590 [Oxalobacteraceae bacterium A2-2]
MKIVCTGWGSLIWKPAKFARLNGRVPDLAEALDYLSALQGQARDKAEQYVRPSRRTS